MTDHKCDVCGAPATNAAQNVKERFPKDGEEATFRYFERDGSVLFGCDTHPVDSEIKHVRLLGLEVRDAGT